MRLTVVPYFNIGVEIQGDRAFCSVLQGQADDDLANQAPFSYVQGRGYGRDDLSAGCVKISKIQRCHIADHRDDHCPASGVGTDCEQSVARIKIINNGLILVNDNAVQDFQ